MADDRSAASTDDLLKPGALFRRAKESADAAAGGEHSAEAEGERPAAVEGASGTAAGDDAPGASDEQRPAAAVTRSAYSGGPIVVNRKRQFGNPVLKHIRRVPYEWSDRDTDMGVDFSLGAGCGCVYLSLKFHRLHPNYAQTRLDDANCSRSRYAGARILLVLTGAPTGDLQPHTNVLRQLNHACLRAGWIMILAHSIEEAGEYLESLKMYERKTVDEFLNRETNRKQKTAASGASSDALWSRRGDARLHAAVDFLSSVRAINRSDAQRLLGTFGSLKRISEASVDQLSLCPGLGATKANNLYDALRAPLVVNKDK